MNRKISVVLSLLAGLGLVAGLLAVCSSAPVSAKYDSLSQVEVNASSKSQTHRAPSAIVPDDQLVVLTYGDAESLDPALDYETAGNEVLMQIYDTLVELKRESTTEFVPLLSYTYTISPDNTTYTFRIREGVKFHNGNALTPSDVAYSFQRGLLQGGSNSPQWLLSEPIIGMGIMDVCDLLDESVCDSRTVLQSYQATHPTEVLQVCTDLASKIVADDLAGTVTFHLEQAWAPFLNILAGSWGSVIDKDWAVLQGAWDGSCSTWQNYYAATKNTSPLRNITNGTGPFKLHHWTPSSEIVFTRNAAYWNTTPLWEGGPFGPSEFLTVTRRLDNDGSSRTQKLINGEADLIAIDVNYTSDLNDATLFHYTQPDGITPTLVYTDGVLKKYSSGLSNSATDAFFTYNIIPGGPRNYIGSGSFNGNGIPANFFSDIHVRKGFNYAFDWDAYNNAAFGGTGVQRSGPVIKPLLGYASGQPKYSYNPTQAMFELTQAWGGDVIDHGFTFTIAYNTGNTFRQKVAEILKSNIESLSPKFHINIAALDWSSQFLPDQNQKRLPIVVAGWIQDYAHPHNWFVPYLIQTYAWRQNLPYSLQSKYETLIYSCIALTGDAARICYENIQTTTYDDSIDIFLVQGTNRAWVNAKIHGYYLNPGLVGTRYYDLYKTLPPETVNVDPEVEQSLVFTPTQTTTTTLDIPVGATEDPIQVVAIPDVQVFNNQPAFLLGEISFNLEAYTPAGDLIVSPTFDPPLTITLEYGAGTYSAEQEALLKLLYWNGTTWEDAACGPYVRDLVNHVLQTSICHFSTFTLGEPGHPIYLPIERKK